MASRTGRGGGIIGRLVGKCGKIGFLQDIELVSCASWLGHGGMQNGCDGDDWQGDVSSCSLLG